MLSFLGSDKSQEVFTNLSPRRSCFRPHKFSPEIYGRESDIGQGFIGVLRTPSVDITPHMRTFIYHGRYTYNWSNWDRC